MLFINSNEENGLDQDSAGNVLQVRSISVERFVKCIWQVSLTVLQELLAGLIICVDYRIDMRLCWRSGSVAQYLASDS